MALLEQIQQQIPSFDGVVTSDDVASGKPAPDGYCSLSNAVGPTVLPALPSKILRRSFGSKSRRSALSADPFPWDADALRDSGGEAAAVLDHLGDPGQPATVLSGPLARRGSNAEVSGDLLSVPDR